jgi:hypothetical protein
MREEKKRLNLLKRRRRALNPIKTGQYRAGFGV